MILIISLNLAIDKVLYIDEFKPFTENRVLVLSSLPGGKGINVARTLRSFNKVSTVCGFKGGNNGKFIEENLKKEGILPLLFEIEQENRVCNIILNKNNIVTEVYEVGPEIKTKDFEGLIEQIKIRKESFQYIVLSGSFPRGINDEQILSLLEIFKDRKFFLDIHGQILLNIINKFEIFFIKINENEFNNSFKIYGEIPTSLLEISKKNKIFVFVVTLGKDGAVFSYDGKVYKIYSDYQIESINPVGAGDAFMGGFVHGIDEGMNIFDALKYGIASSISNATLYEGGRVNFDNFYKILESIKIKNII